MVILKLLNCIFNNNNNNNTNNRNNIILISSSSSSIKIKGKQYYFLNLYSRV